MLFQEDLLHLVLTFYSSIRIGICTFSRTKALVGNDSYAKNQHIITFTHAVSVPKGKKPFFIVARPLHANQSSLTLLRFVYLKLLYDIIVTPCDLPWEH
jgi:hypothetical protein